MIHPVFSYYERMYANERIEFRFNEDNTATIIISIRGTVAEITIPMREFLMLIDSDYYG